MNSNLNLDGNTLIPQPKLCAMLGKSRSGIRYLLSDDPDFPQPIKIGSGRQARCYYVADEVNAWLRIQILKRDKA